MVSPRHTEHAAWLARFGWLGWLGLARFGWLIWLGWVACELALAGWFGRLGLAGWLGWPGLAGLAWLAWLGLAWLAGVSGPKSLRHFLRGQFCYSSDSLGPRIF